MSLMVRRAVAGDAGRLALVAAATFLESYAAIIRGDDILAHAAHRNSEQVYRAALADPDTALWLAETETGAPVGFAMLTAPDLPIAIQATDIELKRIYLFSAFQGGGIGKALLRAAAEEAARRGSQRLLVGVYSGNDRAIGFYRAQGFEPIGERSFQVGSAIFHDIVMARPS